MGRPAWFLHAPYPEDSDSTVKTWVKEQQDKVEEAKATLQRVREGQWNKKNKHRVPASHQGGGWVLVHHSPLPAWSRSTSDDPYFGPYKILFSFFLVIHSSEAPHQCSQEGQPNIHLDTHIPGQWSGGRPVADADMGTRAKN